MQIIDTTAALKARGTMLAPPASAAALQAFIRTEDGDIDKNILEIYSQFDGFNGQDHGSQISIWPINRVISESGLKEVFQDSEYAAVGDLLVDSDFIMWCLTNSELPVYLLHERRELAGSVGDFFRKLIAGQFDFAK